MERTVRSPDKQGYAAELSELWQRVGAALGRLERIADAPADRPLEQMLEELPSLQYALHTGAELAAGIEPPRAAAVAHEELIAAVASARDATAEVAHALAEDGLDLVEPLLPEWRGALFRVRLARLRALERGPLAPVAPEQPPVRVERPRARHPRVSALAATALVLAGAVLFTGGAVLAAWPLWVAGLALFAGGFFLYRP